MTYLSSGARDRANGLSVGARERGAPGHLDAAAEEAGGATGGRAARLARDGEAATAETTAWLAIVQGLGTARGVRVETFDSLSVATK